MPDEPDEPEEFSVTGKINQTIKGPLPPNFIKVGWPESPPDPDQKNWWPLTQDSWVDYLLRRRGRGLTGTRTQTNASEAVTCSPLSPRRRPKSLSGSTACTPATQLPPPTGSATR